MSEPTTTFDASAAGADDLVARTSDEGTVSTTTPAGEA
jgi:hypothetical protein